MLLTNKAHKFTLYLFKFYTTTIITQIQLRIHLIQNYHNRIATCKCQTNERKGQIACSDDKQQQQQNTQMQLQENI